MGLFDKIFTSSNNEEASKVDVPWVKLTSIEQLDEAFNQKLRLPSSEVGIV